MKKLLMAMTAVAAFVVPAAAPMASVAQDADSRPWREQRAQQRRPQGGESPAPRPERRQQRQEGTHAERPGRQDQGGQRPGRQRREGGASGQNAVASGEQARPQASRSDRRGQAGAEPANRPDRNAARRGGQDRSDWHDRDRGDRDGSDGRSNRPDWQNRERNGHRNEGGGDRGDRNEGGGRNWDRNGHDRQEWRQRFDRDSWRRDWSRRHTQPDWWRDDRRFRGWSGVRIGFYFSPGFGYYSVPRSYWGQRYHEGERLPAFFWRYEIRDYASWGLPWPPAGAMWVWVDNNIYLVDRFDGYIIEAIHDAWRW